MKQRNLILQSAIALAFGAGATSAFAGEIGSVPRIYANEANPGTVAVTGPSVNYQWGIAVNPNTDIQLRLTLGDGATWVVTPLPGAMTCLDAAGGTQTATTVAKSVDNTSVTFGMNTGAAGFGQLISTCVFTPVASQMKAPSLNTAGGKVDATWKNFALAAGTEIDIAGNHTATVANSAAAITGKIVASSAFPLPGPVGVKETAVIDLTGNNSKSFTTPGATLSNVNLPLAINLGSVTFTDTPGTQDDGTGADYTLAAKIASLKGTVTGTFQAAAGTQLNLSTGTNCVALVVGGAGVASAPAGSSFTFTGVAVPASGTPSFVCYIVDGIAQIPTTTPEASFETVPTVVTELPDTATGALYTLRTNGATIDQTSYIPAGTVGYVGFTRVVNVGNRATDVVATIIHPDGTAGPETGVIIQALEVGGSRTLTSGEIEAVIGAVDPNERPRLRVFGSTSGVVVQSFMSNPGGAVTNNSGIESSTTLPVPLAP